MRLTGREHRAAALITLIIVALRLWFARKVTFCGTPDSCYALGLAQDLARYHAFRVPFLFDLQLKHLQVPNTGIEYWRPGVSLLLALLKPLGGTTLHGALAIATLAGVVWAAAAWFVAKRATGSARIALASYTLCLLLSPGWGGSLTPDPTLFYAAAIAWFLALFTVERQGLVQDVLALVCVSAAYLIRNDAGLLLIPLVVVLWLRLRRARGLRTSGKGASAGSSVGYAVGMLVGFGLALAPMHLLYRHVLGTAFPAGAGQALYLNDLSDFSNYGVPVSLHTMLSHGVKHLVTMRVGATALIVYRVLALVLGYPALVFLPTLAVRRETVGPGTPAGEGFRLPEITGPVAFGVTVLIVYSLVLPAVGVFSALRSSTALLPVVSVLVVVAILRAARSHRLAYVLTATVIAIYLVSGVMDDRRSIDPMNQTGNADRAQARALEAMGATPEGPTLVMTPDPVQFSVTTGLPAIPMPGNGLGAITKESLELHASHAILDGEHLPGSLAQVTESLHPVQTRTIPGQTVILFELPREPKQR